MDLAKSEVLDVLILLVSFPLARESRRKPEKLGAERDGSRFIVCVKVKSYCFSLSGFDSPFSTI